MTDTPDDLSNLLQAALKDAGDGIVYQMMGQGETINVVATERLIARCFTALTLAASRNEALESRQRVLREELERIEDNLGDYIERKGTVDVSIALAYEVTRATLAGDAG